MAKRSWVQCPDTGKMIPKEEWDGPAKRSATIMGDIDPFISPIDGSTVSSRSHLRAHNAKHGVTDSRDYSGDYMQKRGRERDARLVGGTKKDKTERIELIKRALDERS